MKRFLGVTIMAMMSISIFAACGGDSQDNTQEQDQLSIEEPVDDESDASDDLVLFTGGDFATGVGIITSTSSSRGVTDDANGRVQVDSAIATITVDSNGIIVDAVIDAAQSRVEFNEEGEILTAFDTPMPTKYEQGADYLMALASEIDAEWYQQVDDLTNWIIGRPVSEVLDMPLSDSNRPVDLASYVTINVDPTLNAIEKATGNLMPFDATDDNIRTGMGISTSISGSRQLSDDADARVEVTTTVVSLTLDENDTILAVSIDSPQSRVHINSEGEINPSDLNSNIPTRLELGDEYNMKVASPSDLEWYQQIDSLTEWMVGKTIDEVRGLPVSEDSRVEDIDLASSVTIRVNSIMTAFEKAVENANR